MRHLALEAPALAEFQQNFGGGGKCGSTSALDFLKHYQWTLPWRRGSSLWGSLQAEGEESATAAFGDGTARPRACRRHVAPGNAYCRLAVGEHFFMQSNVRAEPEGQGTNWTGPAAGAVLMCGLRAFGAPPPFCAWGNRPLLPRHATPLLGIILRAFHLIC